MNLTLLKKYSALILVFLFAATVFASDGLLWGKNQLKVNQTQWFDIIYPPECETSATILVENADRLFEEITEAYGYKPWFRMPVTITPESEVFNAYYSSAPYNHIVIFDTCLAEDLAVYSQTLISTFTHELTHAVSYNNKNNFLRGISNFFGDYITFSFLTVTSGWAEGASVSYESREGEGRVNDEFSLHIIKQAKIENKFPKYSDVQGARDSYPLGIFYSFNGPFNVWLQQKYGMEKYAQFWYNCINLKTAIAGLGFKNIYGISINQAWKEFRDDIFIPQNLISVSDEPKSSKESGALYTKLAACDEGFAYVEDKSSSVYFVKNGETKAKKLFSVKNIQGIKLSADGRYVLVTKTNVNHANYKKQLCVYDRVKSRWHNLKATAANDGIILNNNGKEYLIWQSFSSGFNSIYIEELCFDNKKGVEPLAQLNYGINELPCGLVALGNDQFGFILRQGMDYSFIICDWQGQIQDIIPVPYERMVVRYPSYSKKDNSILFTWTQKGSMPRFGKLDLNTKTFVLSNEDFSGGIFYPVAFKNEIVYSGEFYLESKLMKIKDESVLKLQVVQKESENMNDAGEEQSLSFLQSDLEHDLELNSKDFNSFSYYKRGMLIPFSQCTSVSFDPKNASSYSLPFGLTYQTSNPWDGNVISLSAGWGPFTNSAGIEASYRSGTYSSLFNYAVSTSAEFDGKGFKQTTSQLKLTSSIFAGHNANLRFSNSSVFHYGRSNLSYLKSGKLLNAAVSLDNSNYIYGINTSELQYSYVVKTGPGDYERLGAAVAGAFYYVYNGAVSPVNYTFRNGGDFAFTSKVFIPKLIPINCKNNFTYNLPVTIRANLFNSPAFADITLYLQNLGGADVTGMPIYDACISVEAVLFGINIQKAIPALTAIFVNSFELSAGYSVGTELSIEDYSMDFKLLKLPYFYEKYKSDQLSFDGYPYVTAKLGLTPNFGALANNSARTDLIIKCSFLYPQLLCTPFLSIGVNTSF